MYLLSDDLFVQITSKEVAFVVFRALFMLKDDSFKEASFFAAEAFFVFEQDYLLSKDKSLMRKSSENVPKDASHLNEPSFFIFREALTGIKAVFRRVYSGI